MKASLTVGKSKTDYPIESYVQQDDVFIGALTVREYITFTVKLRLSKESVETQNKRIDDLIMLMSLQEK